MKNTESLNISGLIVVSTGILVLWLKSWFVTLNLFEQTFFGTVGVITLLVLLAVIRHYFSKSGRERSQRLKNIEELPSEIKIHSSSSVALGLDEDLKIPVYLSDKIRSRHLHVIGSTGSGKTESVVLNFLRQDIAKRYGAIILDAKGDTSFLAQLKNWLPRSKLRVFDLSSEWSLTYNPLEHGSALESAQRLHSSLTWSEEYYKSKAFSAIQRIFQSHYEKHDKNPTLLTLSDYLETPDSFTSIAMSESYPQELASKDFMELSGLRDQVKSLCTGHLTSILSPTKSSEMQFADAQEGVVLYFRLQSLLSPQIVSMLGKLLINHLNYLVGIEHRKEEAAKERKLIPVYMDEFASFACPEFADLISKARSAGLALHFSHQSIGDLVEVSKGFLNRITDNAATKIVFRINDPDSAEFFARSFGTKVYQKLTQRIRHATNPNAAEILEEGTTRDAHQFRASPDLFKTLPTGVGSVLIAHGSETPHGASSVFKIKFPKLTEE